MNTTHRYLLGIDGGGSGCRAAVADLTGGCIGRGEAGSANIMTNFELALDNIQRAARHALADAGLDPERLNCLQSVLGLAGANVDASRVADQLPFADCLVTSDGEIALQGALGNRDGLVATLGTGSVFLYRRQGVVGTLGGWGHVVGDLGSGAWLGKQLLQQLLLAFDGVIESSPLTQRMWSHFDNSPQRLVEFAHSASPQQFADYASVVFTAEAQHDTVASAIVSRAVTDVESMLNVVPGRGVLPLCLLGGLARFYQSRLSSRYRQQLQAPEADAVDGALALARQRYSA